MKKLLIAMTAAAVGTCAWAAVEVADATLLNENFNKPAEGWSPSNWTVAEDGKVSAVAAPWSYAGGTDVGDGELTLANNALSLNTGSKVLTAAFAGGDAVTIPSTNVYFNATVTFKDPSDTLPELKDSDKFALVVLDNVESIDAKYTSDAATNLWVIAKYGENAQRAYQLDVAVTPIWLADEHEIVVKAYENVMASGYTACAGFIVMVDKAVCKVVQSCALEGNVINYKKSCSYLKWNDSLDLNETGELGYLGYPLTAIDPKYQKHYCDPEDNNTSVLILSNVPGNGTLTSVDFQGQGDIDNVNLAATTTEDFGTDSLAIEITAGPGIVLTGKCEGGTLFYSGSSATVTFTLKAGFALASENVVYAEDKAYSVAIDPADYSNGYTIDSYEPKAFIGGTSYKTFALALAAGGEITLSQAITADDANGEGGFIDIAAGQTVTIDLNGNDIVDIVNAGNLTIKDSVGTGRVLENEGISVSNEGTLTILGGCFEGAIEGATAKGISGGKFKNKTGLDEALADDRAFSTEATGGYYSVVEATVTPLPEITIPDNATAEEEKAAVEAALGTQADAAVKANITNQTEYAEFKAWAGTNGGAATVVASVNAWVAYALDNAGLLDDAKVTLTDNDIKVESFGQDTAEGAAAGQFTLEISLKDVTIGAATKANLLKIFEAVGTTDLKADFTAGAVTTDVMAVGGKAKFTVAPSAATKPNAFFFKAQIKK